MTFKHGALLLTALGAAGCVADVADENVDQSENAVEFLGHSPTTVTFFSEAGLWGDELTVELTPSDNNEQVQLITKNSFDSNNLLGRVSSVRMECGSRDSTVTIFSSHNTANGLNNWSEFGDAWPLYCFAGETVDYNIHAEAPHLADNVGSAYFVTHARQATDSPLSWSVTQGWNAALDELPDGAEPDGEPKLRLTSGFSFRVRQDLWIDHFACGGRGGILELRATLDKDDGSFNVIVQSTYVHTGWGDAWGCRTDMWNELDAEASDAAQELEQGLALAVAPGDPRYYLVPTYSMREFNLYSGGEPFQWPSKIGGIKLGGQKKKQP